MTQNCVKQPIPLEDRNKIQNDLRIEHWAENNRMKLTGIRAKLYTKGEKTTTNAQLQDVGRSAQ